MKNWFSLLYFIFIGTLASAQNIQEVDNLLKKYKYAEAIKVCDLLILKNPQNDQFYLKRAQCKKLLADSVGFDDNEICHDLMTSFKLGNRAAYEMLDNCCLDICHDIITAKDNKENTFCIDVSHQKLEKTPKEFADFDHLIAIEFSHNKLKHIDSVLLKYTSLMSLDYKHNHFQYIPDMISNFKLLEKLNFSNNHIRYISPEIGNLPELKVLNLHGNAIEMLPIEMFSLSKLEYLDLSFNPIHSLPSDISKLVNLRKLNITSTPIVNSKELKSLLPNCEIITGL